MSLKAGSSFLLQSFNLNLPGHKRLTENQDRGSQEDMIQEMFSGGTEEFHDFLGGNERLRDSKWYPRWPQDNWETSP